VTAATQDKKLARQPGVVYVGKYACGWCGSGACDRCVVALENGDGSLLRCGCGCPRSQGVRCVQCGETDPNLVGPGMLCADRLDCEAAVRARRDANPIWQSLQQVQAAAAAKRVAELTPEQRAERQERFSKLRESRPATGTCLCCGEATKGGLFLPGHDARFVAFLSGFVGELGSTGREIRLADARRKLEPCSPALKAKFERKVTR
jgi:hypothetical protein